jgi:hypothetical protein
VDIYEDLRLLRVHSADHNDNEKKLQYWAVEHDGLSQSRTMFDENSLMIKRFGATTSGLLER